MIFRRFTAVLVIVLLAIGALAAVGMAKPPPQIITAVEPDGAGQGDQVVDVAEEADDDDEDDVPAYIKQLAAAEAIGPAMVVVEYTLRFDKGESPRFYGSSGGRYAGRLIEQERPLEVSGFLLSPTTVLTPDLIVHPRFVESISVRSGDNVAFAHPKAYGVDQPAMLLEMDEPLPGTSPLEFDPAGEEPYLGAVFKLTEGRWTVHVGGTTDSVALDETGRSYSPSTTNMVLTTEDGVPVGVVMNDEMPLDDSWKGSPLAWPVISADEMAEQLERIEATADAALVRVALNFRSPQKRPGMQADYESSGEAGTERNVVGVLISDTRVLVLANMRQHITRRLERIDVYPPKGDPVAAQFVGTLKDFGALVAELDSPLPSGVTLADEDTRDFRSLLLMLADVKVQGDNRVAYHAHDRIVRYQLGWQRIVYPVLPGDEEGLFLFDDGGRLIVLPIARRLKTTVAGTYGASPVATAAGDLAFVQGDDLADAFDPNNIPLTEAEEHRLAWLGVGLQPLDSDLARMYQVSDITNDGQSGAIVSYVYPGSPADEAGVQPRWILLRIHAADQPKPLEVRTREWYWQADPFPWADYDQLPEMYYDQIPTPWAPTENALTRSLTDLGFGTAYEAEFFFEGEVFRKPFKVVESPAHYDSAPRHEDDAMGMTVRDMTYEVRRYFLKADDEEGVVISKIEPGGLASVAGLKPHEVITTVNDQPVYNVQDFEDLVAGQAERRLHVMRMTTGRNVKISLPVEDVDEPVAPESLLEVPETSELPEELPELPETAPPPDAPAPAE